MDRIYLRIVFIILMFSFVVFPVYSEDKSLDKPTSFSDNSAVFNKGFDGQKPVTDSLFKRTIKQMQERSLTRKQQKIRKEVKPLSPVADEKHLKDFAEEQNLDSSATNSHMVMIPVRAYDADGQYIQPGYYKLTCRQLYKNNYVIDLSQGTTLVMSIPAYQTQQDLEQETLSFGKADIIDNNRVRIIYGNIDLNLVGYLYIK